jgi:signal peptidase I
VYLKISVRTFLLLLTYVDPSGQQWNQGHRHYGRGDLVVFRYPNDTKKFFIKRVIGLPHEKVVIEGSTIKIINAAHPDGFILEEPYVKNISNNSLTSELKDDEYFVMGDNRSASSDSRYWGPVHRNLFIGKTFLRLLPINTLSYAPGDYKQVN